MMRLVSTDQMMQHDTPFNQAQFQKSKEGKATKQSGSKVVKRELVEKLLTNYLTKDQIARLEASIFKPAKKDASELES